MITKVISVKKKHIRILTKKLKKNIVRKDKVSESVVYYSSDKSDLKKKTHKMSPFYVLI